MVSGPTVEYSNDARLSLQAAEVALQQGQIELATQHLLYGLLDALKAVASSRGLNLRSDVNVWNYADALATGLESPPAFSEAYPVARYLFVDSSGYSFAEDELRAYLEYMAPGVRELLELATGSV